MPGARLDVAQLSLLSRWHLDARLHRPLCHQSCWCWWTGAAFIRRSTGRDSPSAADTIERIEVLQWSGRLGNSNAVNGVINIIIMRPARRPGKLVDVAIGDGGRQTLRAPRR